MFIFDLDLEAGNYDAILEREAEFEPALFEDPSDVNLDNVDAALRVGAALADAAAITRAPSTCSGNCEDAHAGVG